MNILFAKTKNIGMSIIMLIVLLIFFYYYINNENNKNNVVLKERNKNNNIAELDNSYDDKQEEKDDDTNNLNIIPYRHITKDECLNVNDEDKKNKCLAEIQIKDAIATKNSTKCLYINDLNRRDDCLLHLISNYEQDIKKCYAIIDKNKRILCFDAITRYKKDVNLCKKVFTEKERFELEECMDRVKSFKIIESGKQDDIINCKEIKALEYPNLCYMHSFKSKYNNNCRLVPKELKDLCNAVVIANYASNVEMCQHITIKPYQQYCYLRFKVGGGDIRSINKYDSDGDGVSDGDELFYGTNMNNPDTDGDGLSDGDELYKYHSNPKDKDTDGDGLSDKEELEKNTDIQNPDSDGDGILDSKDDNPLDILNDSDDDGLTDEEEYKWGTDPNNKDTDGDGISDYEEIENGTNPTGEGWRHDADNDGLIDADERFFGTDPLNPDTDGDGYKDGDEVINGYNPNGEGKLTI